MDIDIELLENNNGQIEGVPANPRKISDERLDDLKRSVKELPEMLSLREMLVYPLGDRYVVIGGNQRLTVCRDLGFEKVPCKVIDPNVTAETLRRIVMIDNEEYGQTDWQAIMSDWDVTELEDWGVQVNAIESAGNFFEDEEDEEERDNEAYKGNTHNEDRSVIVEEDIFKDILFATDNDLEIPTLLLEMQAGRLELPITPWGANSRLKTSVNTYHFYVDDYRFNALFKDPSKLVASGCKTIVEPNCSCHDQTPIAYGLAKIYKKRYLARYMQELGVRVYADLNVASKFAEYNTLGIPKGWNAFMTRGTDGWVQALENDLAVAREISGLETPNLIVYGGGKTSKEFCQKNGLLFVTDFMGDKFKK